VAALIKLVVIAVSHYVFVESENNPSSDPVIIWSNGGPGNEQTNSYNVPFTRTIVSQGLRPCLG
jgi:hypothetical protein